MDELSAKARPRSGGVWSPNHFVPLVQPQQRFQTPTTQEISSILEVDIQCTISQVCTCAITLFRVRERQRQRTTRQHLCECRIFHHRLPLKGVANTNATLPSSSNDPQPVLRSFAAERKRQERAEENEQRRTQRLIDARRRTVSARQNEDDSQRNKRLADDRQQKESSSCNRKR